ncbi:hypothetical protein Clacol_003234 [Clathrus columnatus]|uniref:Uncharacterized protein n=1 Tax=Clathrus columnatus TaxID=1419009 RepID=A0AAV5A8N9_9AGAM|nr:hypothetical protein Clacol_003234 [Clathrus columnatus]
MSKSQLITEDSTAPLILEEFHDDPTVYKFSDNRTPIDAPVLRPYTPVQVDAKRTPTIEHDFPEGGVRAWCAVAGSFLRDFLSEHTPSQIAWIGSMQLFFIFAVAIFSGKFFDDGYFRELLAIGSILYLFSIYGLIFFVSLLIANLIMRPRLPPRRQRTEQPPKPDIRAILHDYAYLTLILGNLNGHLAFYVQLFAVLKGVSENFAFYSRKHTTDASDKLTILNGSSILGRIIPGLIADKYGTLNTLIVAMFCCAVLLFAMLGAGSVGGLSLSLACIPVYVDNPSEYGFFLLISNPIAGALLDAPHYFWTKAVIFEGVRKLKSVEECESHMLGWSCCNDIFSTTVDEEETDMETLRRA